MTETNVERESGFGGFYNNRNISTKIFGGFGIILAVLAAVSSIGYFNFVEVGKDVDKLSANVESVSIISHMETEFLKLRGHAREFANLGHESDAEAVKEIAENMKPLIDKAFERLTKPEYQAKIAHIEKELNIYVADFHKAEILEHEFRGLIKEGMEDNGEAIVHEIDQIAKEAAKEGNADAIIYAGIAREHALKARLYSNILIGRKDDSFADKVKDEFLALNTVLGSLKKSLHTESEKALFDDIEQRFHKYEAAVEKIHADEIELRKLIDGEMKEAALALTNDAEWLEEQISKDENALRIETKDLIEIGEIEMLVVASLGFFIGIFFAWFIGGSVSKSISGMTQVMTRLAAGETNIEIPARRRTDEIGQMSDAVLVFRDNAIENTRLEKENTEDRVRMEKEKAIETARIEKEKEIAEKRAAEVKTAAMNQMADDFEERVGKVVENVSAAAVQMQSTAKSMSATADKTREQSTTVSAAARQASANVQTVASAAEELSASVSEIGNHVKSSSMIAGTAVAEAARTNEQINSLAQAANKVGEVVNLIDEIAAQTNLLALNATIEAARAGEAGKGFAVVASEVKDLANQTAKATSEITSHITNIQEGTQEAVQAIGKIRGTIDEINEVTTTVAGAIEQQIGAIQEIAMNTEQAAIGTEEVTTHISGVSDAVTETGEASAQVLQSAGELLSSSDALKVEVKTFLDNVRAA